MLADAAQGVPAPAVTVVAELRKYLRREANSRSGYLDERQIAAICEIAAQVPPPAV